MKKKDKIKIAKKVYDQAKAQHNPATKTKHGSLWLRVNAEVYRDRVRELKGKNIK